MNKGIFAVCGAAFLITFAIIISSSGPSLVAWALLSGGVSQFAAQDDHKYSAYASIGFSYTAFILCVAAALGYN